MRQVRGHGVHAGEPPERGGVGALQRGLGPARDGGRGAVGEAAGPVEARERRERGQLLPRRGHGRRACLPRAAVPGQAVLGVRQGVSAGVNNRFLNNQLNEARLCLRVVLSLYRANGTSQLVRFLCVRLRCFNEATYFVSLIFEFIAQMGKETIGPEFLIFFLLLEKVVGEFGGHGLAVKGHLWKEGNNWGYGKLPKHASELRELYKNSMTTLDNLKRRGIAAGIYTQTTDVVRIAELERLFTSQRPPPPPSKL